MRHDIKFNSKEIALIHVLRTHPNNYFTTNQIARRSRLSWSTAEGTLEVLFKRGFVVRGRKGRRVFWRLY